MWPNGNRLLVVAVTAAVLLVGTVGYVVTGLHSYDRYRLAYGNYQLDAASACGALITWSPPHDVFTAFYVNQPSFLTIRYRSPHPQPLRITLSIPRFTQEQSFDVQSGPAFRALSFKPPLIDSSVLDSLVGPHSRDAQIVLRVHSADKVCDTSSPVRLESRQWMQWEDASGSDQSRYLAGWVTPQADVVNTLVGRSAQFLGEHPTWYRAAPALYGYNGGQASHQAVVDQVNALFDTLQSVYQVHYVDENIPYAQNATQLIKLPKDVLNSAAPTGMCIETTVLMASAVEAIGMRPYIIIVPGHAFLGVALSAAPSAPLEYWETSDLNGSLRGDQANIHGDTEYNHYQSLSQILRIIDIEQERQQAIQPIE
ncbi:MAG TPA: hypothetical protein VF818_03885 [Ktedonobacterales bacterium]